MGPVLISEKPAGTEPPAAPASAEAAHREIRTQLQGDVSDPAEQVEGRQMDQRLAANCIM